MRAKVDVDVEEDEDLDAEDSRDVVFARLGDAEAYRRLVLRRQDEIGRMMGRFSRDPAVRDELTHDVFVEAYLGLSNYRGSAPWTHWLRKIAVRVGYRHWTKRKAKNREVVLSQEDWRRFDGASPLASSSPEEAADAAELVHVLLGQLPPGDRLILTLMYLEGCSLAEAADRAGWSVVAAKLRAFRARNRLKKLIEEGCRHE